MKTVIHLPGTKLNPDVVLARTAQKLDRIKGVVVIMQWDDDTFAVDWSQMKLSELCMAGRILDNVIDSEITVANYEDDLK